MRSFKLIWSRSGAEVLLVYFISFKMYLGVINLKGQFVHFTRLWNFAVLRNGFSLYHLDFTDWIYCCTHSQTERLLFLTGYFAQGNAHRGNRISWPRQLPGCWCCKHPSMVSSARWTETPQTVVPVNSVWSLQCTHDQFLLISLNYVRNTS